MPNESETEDESTGPERPYQHSSNLKDIYERSKTSRLLQYSSVCNYWVTEGARKCSRALICSEKEQWKDAMQKEMNSIYSSDIWDLVELPKDRKPVGNQCMGVQMKNQC